MFHPRLEIEVEYGCFLGGGDSDPPALHLEVNNRVEELHIGDDALSEVVPKAQLVRRHFYVFTGAHHEENVA